MDGAIPPVKAPSVQNAAAEIAKRSFQDCYDAEVEHMGLVVPLQDMDPEERYSARVHADAGAQVCFDVAEPQRPGVHVPSVADDRDDYEIAFIERETQVNNLLDRLTFG